MPDPRPEARKERGGGTEWAPLLADLENRPPGRGVALFLDYDGTLVDIAPRPEEARPDAELLRLLRRLAALPGLEVTVVSGRPLADLQSLLPVPGLHLLGSHGGEGRLWGRPFTLPGSAPAPGELNRLQEEVRSRLAALGGWWLETKPLGFALHFRQADPATEARILQNLAPWLARLQEHRAFTVLRGKKVLEILPRGLSKGAALAALLATPEFSGWFPIYCGDDLTDESAFAALRGRGLTVRVGDRGSATQASCTLPHPAALRRFLEAVRRRFEVQT
jgi:trehalose-phosphatase